MGRSNLKGYSWETIVVAARVYQVKRDSHVMGCFLPFSVPGDVCGVASGRGGRAVLLRTPVELR